METRVKVPLAANRRRALLFVLTLVLPALILLLRPLGFTLQQSVILAALVLTIVLEGGLVAAYTFRSADFQGLFPNLMEQLSLFDRFYEFVNGTFDLTAIVYYLTVIAVFVFLTVQSLEKRRWSE